MIGNKMHESQIPGNLWLNYRQVKHNRIKLMLEYRFKNILVNILEEPIEYKFECQHDVHIIDVVDI